MTMLSDGSSSFSIVPSVALMMPAPIRTTSGVPGISVCCMCSSPIRPASLSLRRCPDERDLDPRPQDDIDPPPRLLVQQPPAMPGTGRVLGEQDVAGADGEVLALAGLEIERAAQRDDELPGWRVVPGKGAAGPRLLKRDAGGLDLAAEQVAATARRQPDRPLFERGIAVLTGPNPYAAHHVPSV